MATITVSSSFTSIYSTIPPATNSCQLLTTAKRLCHLTHSAHQDELEGAWAEANCCCGAFKLTSSPFQSSMLLKRSSSLLKTVCPQLRCNRLHTANLVTIVDQIFLAGVFCLCVVQALVVSNPNCNEQLNLHLMPLNWGFFRHADRGSWHTMFTSQIVLLTQTAGRTLTTIKYIVLRFKETTREAYVKRPEWIQLQSRIVLLIWTPQPLRRTYEMSKKKPRTKKQQTYSCCTLFLSTDQCDVSSVTIFDSPQSTMVDKFDQHLCIF